MLIPSITQYFFKVILINTSVIRKVYLLGSCKDLKGGYRLPRILIFACQLEFHHWQQTLCCFPWNARPSPDVQEVACQILRCEWPRFTCESPPQVKFPVRWPIRPIPQTPAQVLFFRWWLPLVQNLPKCCILVPVLSHGILDRYLIVKI